MAVQTGEGTTDIIYGSMTVPAGPRSFGAYLARPDGIGEWPTVVVIGPRLIPTSSVKNICRVFARHGIAAIAPEFTDDAARDRRMLASLVQFMSDPSGEWSNAQFGFGVLALEGGIDRGADLSASDGKVAAYGSIGSVLTEAIVDDLAVAAIPGLFIGSRGDDQVDIDQALDLRRFIPRTSFVVYPDGDSGFWNDESPGFSDERHSDAMDRAVAFFSEQLPPVV